jgi:hypothetical protein
MDQVAELGYVLRRYSEKALDEALPPKSKLRVLYNAVQRGRIQTDAEGAQLIYGGRYSANDKKFVMLKRNLLRKLFDLVLTADANGGLGSARDIARDDAWRRLTIADKLLRENVYHNAERILLKLIKSPEVLHEWDLLAHGHRLCSQLYALKGGPKEAEHHHTQHVRYLLAYTTERSAIGQWELLKAQAKYGIGRRVEFASQGAKVRDALEATLQTLREQGLSPSPYLQQALWAARSFSAFHAADVERQHSICSGWSRYQRAHSASRSLTGRLELVLSCARMAWAEGNTSNVRRWLSGARQLTDYEAYSRFEVEAIEVECAMYEGTESALAGALAIILEVRAQPQYTFLHPLDQAGWQAREALVWIVRERAGFHQISPEWAKAFKRTLSAARVMADTSAALSDRTGLALVLRWINLLLLQQASESLHDEIMALGKYAQRYLRDHPEPRTLRFIAQLVAAHSRKHRAGQEHDVETSLRRDVAEWVPYDRILKWLSPK